MNPRPRYLPEARALRTIHVQGVLVGALWAAFEAVAAVRHGNDRITLLVSVPVALGWTAVVAATLLVRVVPRLRRPLWLPAALAGAAITAAVTFFRLHLDGLVATPWLDPRHLRALAMAVGAGAVAFACLLLALTRGAPGWVPGGAATGAATLILVAALHFTGGFSLHPLRVRMPGDLGRGSPLPYNLLCITIDTLRKDHLEPYGYHRPVGEGLRDRGFTRFERFHATANWTKPTTASLLTGLHPLTHSAVLTDSLLPADAVTLTELLREHGAVTGFFSANINASGTFDLDQGAHFAIDDPLAPSNPLAGTTLGEMMRAHLRLTDAFVLNRFVLGFLEPAVQRRFFLYVHYNDPHAPYRPPRSYFEDFDPNYDGRVVDDPEVADAPTEREQYHIEARYDGEILRTLEAVEALLDFLEEAGVLDRTLVVITADHGEEFRDHGKWTHGKTAYDEMLHVPLLLRLPPDLDAAPVVGVHGNQTDLLPTLCDYLGIEAPPAVQGRSLRPFVAGAEEGEDPPLLSESELSEVWSYEKDGMKLIVKTKGDRVRTALFDLEADPGETRDLSRGPEHAGTVERLMAEAEQVRSGLRALSLTSSSRELDAATLEELRALGYIR